MTLTVRLEPEDGFSADVAIQVDGLPTGVTASALTLTKAKPEGQIILTASAQSAPGPVGLRVMGTGEQRWGAFFEGARTNDGDLQHPGHCVPARLDWSRPRRHGEMSICFLLSALSLPLDFYASCLRTI